MSNRTILLITNIPTPYRIPLFNELDKQLEQRGIKLKVIFGAEGYSHRKWEIDLSECLFDYNILSSRKISYFDREKIIFSYRGLLGIVNRENPDVVISAGFSLATTKLWLRSFFKKTNYIIWSGAIVNQDKPESLIRKIQRRQVIKKADRFISYGTKAKEYLISLGVPHHKISIALNTVDTDFFLKEKRDDQDLREDKRRKNLLYIGHLEKRKRVDLLLLIIKSLLGKRDDFILKLVGDGAQREMLNRMAKDIKIMDHVYFEGFKQKNELAPYLKEADCFLFPTGFDIWGLALVEAMAVGVPCIASIHAGATHDLVRDGINGYKMDFFQTEQVADRVDWILNHPETARALGQNAKEFIKTHVQIENSALAFAETIAESIKPHDLEA
jgi:glycosyltransferase involved in cell wall biosynthesis